MFRQRYLLLLAAALSCESTPEPRPPAPGQVEMRKNPAQPASVANPAEALAEPPVPQDDFAVVYETMMSELADNIVRRTEEASKHDYDNLEDAKVALDEALPQNSLGQLDAVLEEAGVDKKTMAAFMRDNPDVVERVGKDFEEKLAKAEPALAKLVAKVKALQTPDSADGE